MRTLIYIVTLSLILFFGLTSKAMAGPSVTAQLKDVDDLVMISQDLHEDTKVYISPDKKKEEKSCFCSCRDGYWSCTILQCKKHNKECSND